MDETTTPADPALRARQRLALNEAGHLSAGDPEAAYWQLAYRQDVAALLALLETGGITEPAPVAPKPTARPSAGGGAAREAAALTTPKGRGRAGGRKGHSRER
jgi:hypothetical protein